jgi:hypothetical protein
LRLKIGCMEYLAQVDENPTGGIIARRAARV